MNVILWLTEAVPLVIVAGALTTMIYLTVEACWSVYREWKTDQLLTEFEESSPVHVEREPKVAGLERDEGPRLVLVRSERRFPARF